jgi:uncharacterized membrane protein YhaH (DUF805 family)
MSRRGRMARQRYLGVAAAAMVVFATAFFVAAFFIARSDSDALRDSIVPFTVLLVSGGAAAICSMVFLQDLDRNERLSEPEREHWTWAFRLFPPLVVAYWWRHGRAE